MSTGIARLTSDKEVEFGKRESLPTRKKKVSVVAVTNSSRSHYGV